MISRKSTRAAVRLGLGLGVSIFALGSGSALAQIATTCPDGSAGPLCVISNTASVGPISGTLGTAILVNNSGTISGSPAVAAGQAVVLSVNNASGGVIGGGANAIIAPARTGIPLLSFNVTNSGTINGDVSFVEPTPVAPQNPLPGALYYYISDGGTLNGNLQLGTGFSTTNFIQRGADDGVTGTITAGGGIDIYTRSYSQSLELGARALPATFEIEGFEARGAATTLTLTGQGTSINLMGDGNVVNNGTIGLLNTAGLYPPGVNIVPAAIGYYQERFAVFQRSNVQPGTVPLYTPTFGDALSSFVNEGTVNGDIRIAAASFVNNDEINLATGGIGSVITTSAGEDFVFDNSGTIEMTFNAPRSFTTVMEREFDDGVNAAVRIRQALETTTLAGATIENSGSIVGGLDANVAANVFSFTNSGLIAGIDASGYFQRGLTLKVGALDLVLPDANDEFNADSATIINTVDGEIRDSFYAAAATQNLRFENHGTIAASAREDGQALLIETGLLQDDGPGDDDVIDIPAQTFAFTNTGAIDGAAEINVANRVAAFDNSGTVTRTELAINQGNPPTFGGVAAFDVESETDESQSITFNNSGSIIGQDRGGSGLVLEAEAGDGDEPGIPTADASISVVNSGTIQATGGATVTPGQFIGLPQGTAYVSQIAALGVDVESSGTGVVNMENQLGGVIQAGGGLTAVVAASGPGLSQPVWVYSPIANTEAAHTVAVAVAAKMVNIVNSGTIQGGAGTNYFPNTPIIDNPIGQPNGYLAGAIHTSGDQLDDDSGFLPSTDHVTNTATGVIIGSIDLNAGDDRIDNAGQISGDIYMREGNDALVNAGSITGTVQMGDGDDSFTHLLASAVLNGAVDGGAGEDTLSFDITSTTYTGSIDPALRQLFASFEVEKIIGTGQVVVQQTVEVSGGGELNLTEGSSIVVAPGQTAINGGAESVSVSNSGEVVGNVDLGGGDNVLTNAAGGSITGNITTGNGANTISNEGGTINGNVLAGSGTDSLVNSGIISGNVDLGAGSDMLTIGTGGSFGGTVTAGGGTDVLSFNTGSTYAAQTTIDGSSFTGFEQVNNTAGVNSFTGDLSVEEVNVTGGRLIGQAGSTLTGSVDVASGGTFGTAGTVSGNVTIGTGGTLSPGASPAIMTINGNLTIADGTTSTFEFVPVGQSDQIVVNGGSVTIGDNTTVNLTGSLTPGASRDLIVVNGGGAITGEFDIVNRDPGIVGVLRNNGATLQLLGTFVAPAGTTVQADAAINYVNGLLIAGTASTALINAVPTLLSGSTANAAAFGQLTPEAYASASQLGVEQGLALAKAGRAGLAATKRQTAGLFSFAQGLGDWRTLKGDAAIGTSSAKSHSYGVLGGIGFGNESGSVGAFVGYIDSRQTITGRGARTNSDGLVAGVSGHFMSGGFDGTLMLAYDWSEANTRRSVPVASAVSGDYRLRSLVLDGVVGYSFPMGAWAIRPEFGMTHVSTRRGAASETGSAPFALTVDRAKTEATFMDGAVKLKGGFGEGTVFHPWASLGVRHQLEGERSSARAGFVGSSERFTVVGAGRKETRATVGAGASYDLATGLSLYGAYQGEFGGGHSHNVNVGVRFAF